VRRIPPVETIIATLARITAPAATSRPVTASFSTTAPSVTATTGLTYA
jgi:hypothetical protein